MADPESGQPDGVPSANALRAALIAQLQASGVLSSQRVEQALARVPRHLFLPASPTTDAYRDIAVPTHWQEGAAVSSASQPAIVALMLEQLQLERGMRVLEIGAGTGYNAALLSELVAPGSVTTLDIDPEIVAEARAHLDAAGYPAVRAVVADGADGWPASAPYDRIELTVAASDIEPSWFEQLAEDGVLVLPLWVGGTDASVAFRKQNGALHSESLKPCGFMRLRGNAAVPSQSAPLPQGRKLYGERAQERAQAIAPLLETRPRRVLWTHTTPAFLNYLGARGYAVVSLFTARKPPRVRYGVFMDGDEGPSLALFANRFPLMLIYGSPAAQRVLAAERDRWPHGAPPLEQWSITAHPITDTLDPPPMGATRIARRHFAYDIVFAPSQTAEQDSPSTR